MLVANGIKPPLWAPGFQHTHPLANGLVGLWPVWNGPSLSTRLMDISGNGNDGVLTNMTPATDWVSSRFGHALDFDGSNDHVVIGAPAMTTAVTAMVIFRQDTTFTGRFDAPMARWHSTVGDRDQFFIYIQENDSNKIRFGIGDGSSSAEVVGPTISTGTWYTVIGRYSKVEQRLTIWVNGAEYGPTTTSLTMNAATITELHLANLQTDTTTHAFAGRITDAALWNVAVGEGLIAEVTADPWGMIRPRQKAYFFMPPTLLVLYANKRGNKRGSRKQ